MKNSNQIKKGDYFVSCWGYDQTQYSVYRVERTTGKSTVYVQPVNSWSSINNNKLAAGSIVKAYNYERWDDLPVEERENLQERGWTWWLYEQREQEKAKKEAIEVEVIKNEKGKWASILHLSDGRKVDLGSSRHEIIEKVKPLRLCRVNFKRHKPSIRINSTITAYLDDEYLQNKERYDQQNSYTLQNGR